jgi:uncharacterized protein (DUF302 family)
MDRTSIYTTRTGKSLPVFIDDLDQIMRQRGFFIHNRENIDMAASFAKHDLELEPGFDLHMIQICKPGKAAFSLGKNPRRATLMPKFITVFSEEGRTVIQFLMHGRKDIERLVDDRDFPDSLADTYRTIIDLIEAAC